jgi:acyl CoA:acetate/3-ketoacid CoA transferase beta subunit
VDSKVIIAKRVALELKHGNLVNLGTEASLIIPDREPTMPLGEPA